MSIQASDAGMVQVAARPIPSLRARLTLLRWHWVCLALILCLSAGLEFIGLTDEGYANTYYAAGVKSMLTSWHNFFFVSYDAGGFVTLDKPPVGLWIEAASAKLLGFSGFSILLPEALAGVLAVALLYYLVARVFGNVAGLLAALVLALTPISVIVDRNNTIDSLLILTLLMDVWAISRATERSSLRWLLLAAAIVGVGFNIKMLQAYLVVPGFALAYLLGARLSWIKRLLHLFLAAITLLIVSLSWVVAVDLTPANLRPFVSDSGTNSELSLVLGYNGLGRLTEALFSGVSQIKIFGDPIDLTIVPAFAPNIGNPGLFRLFSTELGGQASWFLLPALVGLLAMVRLTRPRLPLQKRGQALVIWGGWLAVAGAFFSTARFFHLYYLVMIAPATAALAGIGLAALWSESAGVFQRVPDPGQSDKANLLAGWRGWLLPMTLVGTALLQARFLDGDSTNGPWLVPLLIGGSLVAAGVLVIGQLRLAVQLSPAVLLRVTRPIAIGGMVAGLIFLLVAPTTWAVSSIASGQGGAWLPQAGSGTTSFDGGPGGFRGGGPGGRFGGGQGGFGFNGGSPNAGGFGGSSNVGGFGGPGGGGQPATGLGTTGNTGAAGGSGKTSNAETTTGAGTTGTSRSGATSSGATNSSPATGTSTGNPSFPGGAAGFGGPGNGRGGFGGFGGGGFGGGGSSGANTFAGANIPTLDPKLLAYLEAQQGKTRFLVATTTSSYASLFILATNQPVMALGGYQGWDRILTPTQLAQDVANGTIRFFYLPAASSSGFGSSGNNSSPGVGAGPSATGGTANQNLATTNDDLTSWVQTNCAAVSSQLYQTTSSSTASSGGSGRGSNLQLYDCAAHPK